MKVYAVLDTNVLVSALLSRHNDSATVQVVDYLFSGYFIPLLNEEIFSEYYTVLHRRKFNFPELSVNKILLGIRSKGVFLHRTKSDFNFPDSDDAVFYEVALSKENSFLVTGNVKHFPATSIIVTPAEFLSILQQRSEVGE